MAHSPPLSQAERARHASRSRRRRQRSSCLPSIAPQPQNRTVILSMIAPAATRDPIIRHPSQQAWLTVEAETPLTYVSPLILPQFHSRLHSSCVRTPFILPQD